MHCFGLCYVWAHGEGKRGRCSSSSSEPISIHKLYEGDCGGQAVHSPWDKLQISLCCLQFPWCVPGKVRPKTSTPFKLSHQKKTRVAQHSKRTLGERGSI